MSDETPEIRTGVYTVTVGKRESDGMPVSRVRRFEKPLTDEEAMTLFGALWRSLAFHGAGAAHNHDIIGVYANCPACEAAAEAAGPEPDFPPPSVATDLTDDELAAQEGAFDAPE